MFIHRSRSCSVYVPFVLAMSVIVNDGRPQQSRVLLDTSVIVCDTTCQIRTVLDLDGDGDPDALSFFNGVLAGLENDGTGAFTQRWSLATSPFTSIIPRFVRRARFDGDNRDDFILVEAVTVRGFRSNGASSAPTEVWSVNVDQVALGAAVADFNADGLDDVAIATFATAFVWISAPIGPPTVAATRPLPAQTFSEVDHLLATDATGDGVPDLIFANVRLQSALEPVPGLAVHVYPFTGSGFAAESVWVVPLAAFAPPDAFGIAAGDIDGDLDTDVVVFEAHEFSVLRRTGPGTFNLEPRVLGGPATGLADIDADGDLDGICCGGGGPFPANQVPGQFELSTNDGSGRFGLAFSIPALGSAGIAGAVDLDRDGDVDLIAGRCAYFATGPILESLERAPVDPGVSQLTTSADLVDVDGDGDLDIHRSLGRWLRNLGNGVTESVVRTVPPVAAGSYWSEPGVPGDFDGDGDADLLVIRREVGTNAYQQLHMFVNAGDGTFTMAPPAGDTTLVVTAPLFNIVTPMPFTPANTRAVDMDGDGDLDLLVWDEKTAIFKNEGGGTFTRDLDVNGRVFDVGDATGDGIPELLTARGGVTNGSFYGVYVWVGSGEGVFQHPLANSSLMFTSVGARFTDLDGDGDLDVLADLPVTLSVNLGAGQFVAGMALPQATDPTQASTARDLDGDGLPELLLSSSMEIYTRASASAPFTGPTPHVLADFAPTVTPMEDVDGDGDVDVIASRVTRGRRWLGDAGGRRWEYGTGLAGTGGIVPRIGDVGPFRAGSSGSIRISAGLGDAAGVMVLGFSQIATPIVGGTLLATPDILLEVRLSGASGMAGAGRVAIPWTLPPWSAGLHIFKQAGFADPSAPQGISLTNGLAIMIGG